jgi:cytochrome c
VRSLLPHPPSNYPKMRPILALAILHSFVHAAEFENTICAEALRDPMELAVAPGGNLIVIEREGRMLRIHPATGGVFEMGKLPVTALRSSDSKSVWAREDGLLGLALDPDFAANQQLYLYFSHPQDMLNRLARFTVKDGLLDLSSEQVLLDIPTDRRDSVCHQAGSLAFDRSGLLYLSTGDNTNPFESDGFSPLDERPSHEHANSMRSAGNTNDLRGKILRIRPTEHGYEVPAGNLFPPGTGKTRPEIYAMGCRNPFRISIDPKTNFLYWGEVGPDSKEIKAQGPLGHDEINQAKAAGNFGWPFVLADNKPYALYDFTSQTVGTLTDPAAPKNPSRLNTGLADLPPAQKALIWYPYAQSAEFPVLGEGGRNAMAGPVFYHSPARKYNLLGPEDDHTLLTYDWMRGKLWKAKLTASDSLEKIELLLGDLQHPMDTEMDADGSLWLLEYGSGWYFNENGRIRRIRPVDGNRAPTLTVATQASTYTATASDPDGDEVTVNWWLTEGAGEKMIGTGLTLTHASGGSELRAVATDSKGAVTVSRISLTQAAAQPGLELVLATQPARLGFGDTLPFTVKGAQDRANLVVRARYIPPTGHDSGGPQFSSEMTKLVVSKQCLACHQVDRASVGPAYLSVAMKYREDPSAAAKLQAKLKVGGGGVWGAIPMPPQATVSETDGEAIVQAILDLATGMVETKGCDQGSLKLAAEPQNAEQGGAWEISAEAPGHSPAKILIPAT